MNTKFQIQIKTNNYNGGSSTITKEISLNSISKFANLIAMINKNVDKVTWNWFPNALPTKWDGNNYVLDTWLICKHIEKNFDYKIEDINLFKEFYLRFTPNGADRIEGIKLFKVEEITEYN